MKRKRLVAGIVVLILIAVFNSSHAMPPDKRVVKTADGVIIYPDRNLSGNVAAVRLQVISDKIIRVVAAASKEIAEKKSLITVYTATSKNWTLTEGSDKVVIKTPILTAMVVINTGAVSFTDKDGKAILKEKEVNGREMTPSIFDGQKSYGLSQTFTTSDDDAYYGLGQHQDDLFNYKGQQVNLFQNNTEVGVPFLVSKKKLWYPMGQLFSHQNWRYTFLSPTFFFQIIF